MKHKKLAENFIDKARAIVKGSTLYFPSETDLEDAMTILKALCSDDKTIERSF